MNLITKHVGRTKPPHMPVLEHFEDSGVKTQGKGIPESSTRCRRQDYAGTSAGTTAKSTWPACCETAPATVNSRTTARWSQHML